MPDFGSDSYSRFDRGKCQVYAIENGLAIPDAQKLRSEFSRFRHFLGAHDPENQQNFAKLLEIWWDQTILKLA